MKIRGSLWIQIKQILTIDLTQGFAMFAGNQAVDQLGQMPHLRLQYGQVQRQRCISVWGQKMIRFLPQRIETVAHNGRADRQKPFQAGP